MGAILSLSSAREFHQWAIMKTWATSVNVKPSPPAFIEKYKALASSPEVVACSFPLSRHSTSIEESAFIAQPRKVTRQSSQESSAKAKDQMFESWLLITHFRFEFRKQINRIRLVCWLNELQLYLNIVRRLFKDFKFLFHPIPLSLVSLWRGTGHSNLDSNALDERIYGRSLSW